MNPYFTFINQDGAFRIPKANQFNYTYFPLVGNGGLRSSITPSFHGDLKLDQNAFLLLPVSQEDLHASLLSRNLWFNVDGNLFSINDFGLNPNTETTVEGGFLYHTLTKNHQTNIVEITSFIPYDNPYVELHKVTYHNPTKSSQNLTFTTAIPLYGRSAESIRDHRHVTALLNQVYVEEHGIINQPTMTFDERGHKRNHRSFGVFAFHKQAPIKHRFPIMEEFVGEGHTLLRPEAITSPSSATKPSGSVVSGYEAMGGLMFDNITIQPGETTTFIVALPMGEQRQECSELALQYHREEDFDKAFNDSKHAWKKLLGTLQFQLLDDNYSNWLKWVTIQPILRRLFGNSFLPHHDYGKGGRGWRDLWQDALALLFLDPHGVESMLKLNYAGVRMDGSNATIIGDKDGEFKSDRNHIVRVWMDHGVWPFLTTKEYIHRSGDVEILFTKQRYFYDQHTHYARQITNVPFDDSFMHTGDGSVYEGTILEHILIENLVPFFNVDKHNIMRLENADWNDGLDMGSHHGESVAFTAMYQKNLRDLADIIEDLIDKGVTSIDIAKEVVMLFDQLSTPVDYEDVTAKQDYLHRYFDKVATPISGETVPVSCQDVIRDLRHKADFITHLLRTQEWLEKDDIGFYNGYYDDDSNRLESVDPVHMTLTGQVFTIMSNVATRDQIPKIVQAADQHLYDPTIGGYKLNTNFNDVKTNMGRMFGFAYGHKENGAVFSHMAVMYANALYQRGFIQEGRKAMTSLYKQVLHSSRSKMYPCLPEYFDAKGRGMYSYLTGSASWYLYTLVTEVFGIKGWYGDLVLQPKLVADDMQKEYASITTLFHDKTITITYHNVKTNTIHQPISHVDINGQPMAVKKTMNRIVIPSEKLQDKTKINVHYQV